MSGLSHTLRFQDSLLVLFVFLSPVRLLELEDLDMQITGSKVMFTRTLLDHRI